MYELIDILNNVSPIYLLDRKISFQSALIFFENSQKDMLELQKIDMELQKLKLEEQIDLQDNNLYKGSQCYDKG